MDFSLSKETITTNEFIYSGTAQQAIDCDLTLPEYCPDILRILKCQLIPRVSSNSINTDRLTIEGSALLRILYVDENGDSIHSYEQICPFSKSIDLNTVTDSAFVDIETEVDYVNCRAVNQRRININGAIALKISISSLVEKEIISSAEGNGIQTQTCTVKSSTVKGYVQKTIAVDETLELNRSDYPVANLIRYDGDVIATDIKVIANKVLVKGELAIKMLYTIDNDTNKTEVIAHSLPISQILDVDGVDDDSNCKVTMKLMSLDLSLRSDSNGELRQGDVVAKILITALAVENVDMQAIKEAYSIKCGTECEKQNIEFISLADTVEDIYLNKSSIDVASTGVTSIIDIWGNVVSASAFVNSEKLLIRGILGISMLVYDISQQIAYLERQIDFETEYNLNRTYLNSQCSADIKINGIDYTLSGNNKIDVRTELRIASNVYNIQQENIIVNLSPDELDKKSKSSCPLTIYFSDENENVWDIAKKYNTTVAAIVEENDLKSEILEKPCMLMIPGV